MLTKAVPGRGSNRSVWVEDIHNYLDYEFERMMDLGVKLSKKLLI